jgi:phosphoribosylformylglycinamidine cyclo-ligase
MGLTYKDAGVDIEAGDALVERIKPFATRTLRPEVVAGVGGFGGLFAIPPGRYREPVLVSSTDGVGTKLKIAIAAGKHDTVGIDLVAMSVNDILTSGAEPLFFLDYLATGRLDVDQAAQVVKGIAEGCERAGCTLLGGETAEHPGAHGTEYDLAGFGVGIVERSRILTGATIRPGDVVLGLASTGVHSNGYSLVRRILSDARVSLDARPGELGGRTVADVLLEPTRIYVKDVLALLAAVEVKGLAHITGSGLPGNVPRCLPEGTRAVLEARRWPRPPVFDWLQRLGGVSDQAMDSTFNMGLGMVAMVKPAVVAEVLALLAARGVPAWEVGRVEASTGEPTAVVVR